MQALAQFLIQTDGAFVMNAAAQRIKQALLDGNKQKGWRGPDHGKRSKGGLQIVQRQHIALTAGDVVEACDSVISQTQIVTDLRQGSAALPPEAEVVIYADDAFHLVEQCGLTLAAPSIPASI